MFLNDEVKKVVAMKGKRGVAESVYILMLILSMFTVFRVVVTATNNYIPMLFAPAFFFIAQIVLVNRRTLMFKSVVFTVVVAGYFIRLVVAPLLYSFSDYTSFYNITIERNDVLYASMLMGLEFLLVSFVLKRGLTKWADNTSNAIVEINAEKNPIVNIIILLMLLFMIFSYISVPQLSTANPLIFNTTFSDSAMLKIDNETIVARGTNDRYLYSLFNFLLPIFRYIVPVYLLSKINQRNRINLIVKLGIILLIPFLILNSSNAQSIHCVVMILIIISRIYKKETKVLIVFTVTLGIIVVAMFVVTKIGAYKVWRGYSGISMAAQFINAYFPGIDNAAIMHQINRNDYFSTLLFDLYYVIPFQNTLFGLVGDNLQDVFTVYSSTGSQVLPWCSQLSHYLTIFFSPIVTCIFINKALKYERRFWNERKFWTMALYVYFLYMTAVAVNIYSFSIYLSGLVNVGIPLLIIKNTSEKIHINRNNNTL